MLINVLVTLNVIRKRLFAASLDCLTFLFTPDLKQAVRRVLKSIKSSLRFSEVFNFINVKALAKEFVSKKNAMHELLQAFEKKKKNFKP